MEQDEFDPYESYKTLLSTQPGALLPAPSVSRTLVKEVPIAETPTTTRSIPPHESKGTVTLVTILGGWLLATALAVGHHAFLIHMDGKVISNESVARLGLQFWIKAAATAFVRAVVLALTISATATLTQVVR